MQHSALPLTFIKLPFVIKTFFVYVLVTAKDRFYCTLGHIVCGLTFVF